MLGGFGSEFADLKPQIATSSWGGIRKAPKVFTEQGVAMLSAVLNSPTAILVSMKDLGKKCFGFTKMDAGEIERIKKAAFNVCTVAVLRNSAPPKV